MSSGVKTELGFLVLRIKRSRKTAVLEPIAKGTLGSTSTNSARYPIKIYWSKEPNRKSRRILR